MSETQRRNVLVTGSAGTIGRVTCSELIARGHAVRGFDRQPTDGLDDARVGDLADADAVNAAVSGVDTIVQIGAFPTQYGDFVDDLVPSNFIGVYNVFAAAVEQGVKRVVVCSSSQVVSGDQRLNRTIRVDDPPTPQNTYAVSKVYAEAMAKMYADRTDLSTIVVRPCWVPRSRAEVDRHFRNPSEKHKVWYCSHNDVARCFACAVEADAALKHVVVFAVSKPPSVPLFDLTPGRELIGFEPQDGFLEGLGDLPETDPHTEARQARSMNT